MATGALPDFGDWVAKQADAPSADQLVDSTGKVVFDERKKPSLPAFGDWVQSQSAEHHGGASDSWAITPGERIKSVFTGPGTFTEKPGWTAPGANFENLLQGVSEPEGTAQKIARGMTRGELAIASSLTSPLNAALAIGTGGVSAIEGKLGTDILGRLIAGGFSMDMIYQAGKQAPELWDAIKTGNWEQASKTLTEIAASGAMGAAAGRHALGSRHPFEKTPGVPGKADSATAPTDSSTEAQPKSNIPETPTMPGSSPAEPPVEKVQPSAATLPDFGEWVKKQETPAAAAPAAKPKKLTPADVFQQAGQILNRWESGDAALSEDERGVLRDHLARTQGGATYEKLGTEGQGKVDDLLEVLHRQYRDRPAAPAEVSTPASEEVSTAAPEELPAELPVVPEAAAPAETSLPVATSSNEPAQARQQTAAGVQDLPVDDVHADPGRFQFKAEAGGKAGVTGELKDIKKFDPELAGVIAVWKDPADGKTYVINGHHRLELAKRTGASHITARHIDAADAGEARMKGALINIAEGRGTAIDAGKVFREGNLTPQELEQRGVSIKGPVARDGLALSKLAPSIFDRVVQGELPVQRAAIIGETLPDFEEQKAAVDMLEAAEKRGKRPTNDEVREIIDFVKGAPKATVDLDQGNLFGESTVTKNLILEKAEVSDYIRKRLSSEKKLFTATGTAGAAERLGRAGNVIKAEENARIAQETGQAAAVYDKLKTSSGPIADALDSAARELAAGEKSAAQVKQDAYERIRQAVSDTLGGEKRSVPEGSRGGDPGGGGEAPPGLGSGDVPETGSREARPGGEEQTSAVTPEEETASRQAAKEDQGTLDVQRATQEIQFGKGKELDAGKESIEDSPLFGGPRQGGLDLGVGFGAAQPYVDSFWQRDVKPALEGFAKGSTEIADLLAKLIAPRRGGFFRTKTPEKGLSALYRMKGGVDEANALLDRQLEAWRSDFRRMTGQQKVEFVDAIKRGRAIANTSLDALKTFMRKGDDYLHEEISKHRSLTYIADHWRVMYKTPPAWEDTATGKPIDRTTQNLGRRPLRGSLGFTKQHFLDDWTDGLTWRTAGRSMADMQKAAGDARLAPGDIQFKQTPRGLEAIPFNERARNWLEREEAKGLKVKQRGADPQSWDPIEMYQQHYADATKYIYAQRFWDEAGRLGLRKWHPEGSPVPDGYVTVDDAIARKYLPPPGPRARVGDWVIEENTGRLLNNHMSRDLIREVGVGRFAMGIKNWSTAIELSISPFHLVFEGNEVAGTAIGHGMRQLFSATGKALVEKDFKTAARLAGQGFHELATAPLQAIPFVRGNLAEKIPGLRTTADRTGATARKYFKEVGPSAFRVRDLAAEETQLTNRLQQMRANNPAMGPMTQRLAAVQADLAASHGDFAAAVQKFQASPTGRGFLARFPDAHEGLHDYFQAGGRLSMHEDYRINAQKGIAKAALDEFHAGNPIGATIVRSLPALNEMVMKPLFDVYIPNLKIATFLKERQQALLENEGRIRRGAVTREQVLRGVNDFIDDRFGELNWDNLFWNRTFKSSGQLLFRSLTWKLGNLRASAGAAVMGVPRTIAHSVDALKHGEAPALDQKLAWGVGMTVWTTALGYLISKGVGGVTPQNARDVLYPMIDKANNIRVSLPTYWRDWLHLAHSPSGYLASGATGEIGRIIDVWQNRDFYGNEVYSEDDPILERQVEKAKHLMPLPFSVSSARAVGEQGGSDAAQKAGYLGFTKAPAYIEQSDALQKAHEYRRGTIPQGSRTTAQAEHSRQVRTLTNQLRGGRDVSDRIEELHQAGQLSDADLTRIQREGAMTDLQTAVTPLSIDKAVHVYELATPEEQEQISEILTNKLQRAIDRNPAELTPALWQKLVELGFIDPNASH